jgi:sporulation protein YabP
MQAEKKGNGARTLSMVGREELSLTGVEDVLRFDEETVVCKTADGELVVEGSALRIVGFSSTEGTLAVRGALSGLFYDEKKGKKKSGSHWWSP